MTRGHRLAAAALLIAGWPVTAFSYPLDGYEETGIRRVEASLRAHQGTIPGGFQPPGAQLTTEQVQPRLLDHRELEIPAPDSAFSRLLVELLGQDAPDYVIAVLDLTHPAGPAFAEHQGNQPLNTGSVGKLIGAIGLFQALADAWPGDEGRRAQILHDTVITADEFSQADRHSIRIFDVDTNTLARRSMQVGDQGNLWEYLDWMLSASANSAASMVMRDAMLLRRYGTQYPVPEDQIDRFFGEMPAAALTRLFQETFSEPLARNGLDRGRLRQGSFFTSGGKRRVNGGGGSYASPRSLVQMMLRMEQGRLVDEWSSRQLKRLLYMTEARIRYASSPALRLAAVYFKSGSFYKCKWEKGFDCGQYEGNVFNYMSSVAVVEEQVGETRLHYVVAATSNVLRRNSAREHQSLATAVHGLIRKRNGID